MRANATHTRTYTSTRFSIYDRGPCPPPPRTWFRGGGLSPPPPPPPPWRPAGGFLVLIQKKKGPRGGGGGGWGPGVVSIIKWSQNCIFVEGSDISGIPKLPISMKFYNHRVGQNSRFCPQKLNSETTLQLILLPHYYYKVVSDIKKIDQKMLF